MSLSDWEVVIGLEIHAQMQTKSKIFSPDSTDFGSGDNENTHPISLGMPGTLPLLNEQALSYSVKAGLALNCDISEKSIFARKNYFYPDLPKGYQISQLDAPLCKNGYVEFTVEGEKRRVNLERAHMEEDAGKSTHHGQYTLINLNRAGVPLLEIVSKPEIRSAKEAAEYAKTVRKILRYAEVCDGNLEEGSLRCDCNVSVRKRGETKLGTRCEIKNVNSFRFVEKAIDYEMQRQVDLIEGGGQVVQQTRLYDAAINKTIAMRDKEDSQDYRYFPDPDLLPVTITEDYIAKVRGSLAELPSEKVSRFQKEYELSDYDCELLTEERHLADYFEKVARLSGNPKAASNWIQGEVLRVLNESELSFEKFPLSAEHLAELIGLIDKETISGKIAKKIFQETWQSNENPEEYMKLKNLIQITDTSMIDALVDRVLSENPSLVAEFKSGKTKVLGFFVGQIMKETKGQASPEVVNKILLTKLNS